jgi:hypothetical protein
MPELRRNSPRTSCEGRPSDSSWNFTSTGIQARHIDKLRFPIRGFYDIKIHLFTKKNGRVIYAKWVFSLVKTMEKSVVIPLLQQAVTTPFAASILLTHII